MGTSARVREPGHTPAAGPGAWLDLVKLAARKWLADKAPRLGAAVAFYSMLSLAPLLVITIAVVGLAFGEGTARAQVVAQARALVGPQGAEAVAAMVEHARRPGAGILASALGFATLLFGASGVFGELKDALNSIWGVKPPPGGGIGKFIRDRALSFAMVLLVGFLLLAALVLTTALAGLAPSLAGSVPALAWALRGAHLLVSLGVYTLLFALVFRVLPDARIAWRDVWVGAAITATLFAVGTFAIGLYLSKAGVGSPYGAAGSLAVLLVWVYYSAQVLFFGAEVTQVYANRFGSRIVSEGEVVG
jgi:membrane protein